MLTGLYWALLSYLILGLTGPFWPYYQADSLNLHFPSVVFQATGYSSEEFGEFCIGEVSSGLCIMDEW